MARRPRKTHESYQDQDTEQEKQKLPAEREGAEPTRARPSFHPRVDILETDAGMTILADVPGTTPDGISITLERRQLTIHASVADHSPEGMSPLYLEYEVGDWERSFTLSRDFDMEKIEAALKNGVLTLTLPRAPEHEAKRIQVKAG